MISHTTIDNVRDLPIEDVIGRFVDLKKAGVSLKACCPLHGEKSPSFIVTPHKNIFKCFGCGAGGDAITFVMEHEKINFIEAVRYIAGAHGVAIEETESQKTPAQVNEEEIFTTLLQQAQLQYRKLLLD